MKQLLTSPTVLTCVGIIVMGIFALVWAVGKWRKLPSSSSLRTPDDILPPASDLRDIDFRAPAMTAPPPAPTPVSTAVSKDVAARLDSMSQRLAEMQTVLQKQAPVGTAQTSSAPGAMGQGFSPETIDKLLKIIGNVIQQVDILQKSMNVSKE